MTEFNASLGYKVRRLIKGGGGLSQKTGMTISIRLGMPRECTQVRRRDACRADAAEEEATPEIAGQRGSRTRRAAGRGDGGRGRRDEGWKRPGLGARCAAPRLPTIAEAQPCRRSGILGSGRFSRRPSWWPWRPPRERFFTARRRPCPAPPRSAPSAASAATVCCRLL